MKKTLFLLLSTLIVSNTLSASHSIYFTFPAPNQFHYEYTTKRLHLNYGLAWDAGYHLDYIPHIRTDNTRDSTTRVAQRLLIDNIIMAGYDLVSKSDLSLQIFLGINNGMGFSDVREFTTASTNHKIPVKWKITHTTAELTLQARKYIGNYYVGLASKIGVFSSSSSYGSVPSNYYILIGYVFHKEAIK